MFTTMKFSVCKICGWGLLLLTLWGSAVGIRRAVYHQQTRTLQGETDVPFLMESALQFRMTEMVLEEGTLPEIDDKVQFPEGVNMRETYSVGAEWIYATLAGWFPKNMSFANRVRWVSLGLFSLAIPLAALWAALKYRSIFSGIAAGGLLAISPSFSVRSSGLELSRENLAIPLFTLFLLAETGYQKAKSSRTRWIWALVAALSIALAQCVWDLTQYVTGLWVVWGLFQRIKTGKETENIRPLITLVTCSLFVVSWWNPYLRAHSFIFSPVMALLLARCLLCWVPSLRQRVLLLLLPLGIWGLWWGLGQIFVENYSHFGNLFWAKIRFLNQKPADPGLLNYSQRIMWTPALNSSTWLLTKAYFPLCLYIFGISLICRIRGVIQGRCRFNSEFFYAGFTLAVYVFFFRFHVFLILFLAVCIASLWSSTRQSTSILGKWIFPSLGLLLFLGIEFYSLLFFEPKLVGEQRAQQKQIRQVMRALGGTEDALPKRNRWGSPGAAYRSVTELNSELSKLPEPGPILANFGISASILAETELPIVLHPKFETPGIRERVKVFYEKLFLESEKDLRDWAIGFGAKYYVHSNGNFSDLDPSNSPRYMVDALDPPEGAAVYTLENRPQDTVWFRPLFSNARYRIYRIITPEDIDFAERYTRLAAIAYESGDSETARKRAMQALSYHWKYLPAQRLLQEILSSPQN